MAAYDDVNVKRIFAVGIISVVLIAVTALAVQVLFYNMLQWQQDERAAQSSYASQNQSLQEQSDAISTYGVNTENGNFIVPVDQVMTAMAKEASDDDAPSSGSASGDSSSEQ